MTATDRPDPSQAVLALSLTGSHEVGNVRRRVTRAACEAGLSEEHARQFTVAVNEMIINAIQHGGGFAEITITTMDGAIVVEVRDHGPGMPDGVPVELPPADQSHGRGLWLARQLCPDVTIHSTGAGSVVRLADTAQPDRVADCG